MNDKTAIHTTIKKSARKILEETAGPNGIGNLISQLAEQMQGGQMREIVVSPFNNIPPPENTINIADDILSQLQNGIIIGSRTLVGGDIGTGKTAILLNIASEISLSKPVLLISTDSKANIEKGLKSIYYAKQKKLIGNEDGKTILNLKVSDENSLFGIIGILDQYKILPVLLIDNLEELTSIGSDKFNRDEWKFFKKTLVDKKVTAIMTTGLNKDCIMNNSVLGFDSIFYMVQTPMLLNGRSRLARYVITYKSHAGTINPREYVLNKYWQIKFYEHSAK